MITYILGFLLACSQADHRHGASSEEHGHGHEHEEEAIQQTIWTPNFEVFVEYPPLKKGKDARFLVHMTWLNGHRPVTSGRLSVHIENTVDHQQVEVDSPARTGIFIPDLTPKNTGEYRLYIKISSEGVQEEIELGDVEISEGHSHGHGHAHGAEEPEISFLKEQAWKIEFQTDPVVKRELSTSLETVGTWKYSPLAQTKIVAPVSGIVSLGEKILMEGQEIERGELLVQLHSGELTEDSFLVQLQLQRAQWLKVQSEYERKQSLFEKGVLSKADWEDVAQRYQMTKAKYDVLSRNNQNGSRAVRSSMAGQILDVSIENGDFVTQGEELFSLVANAPSLIVVELPQRYLSATRDLKQIAYQVGREWKIVDATAVPAKKMKLKDETVLLTVAVPPETNAIEGTLVDTRLIFGIPEETLVIPRSSLLEEYGAYSIVKQISGEGFSLQSVKIGKQDAEFVEILSGVEEGDWVVSKGAYLVKMMSLSGELPAHGHAH